MGGSVVSNHTPGPWVCAKWDSKPEIATVAHCGSMVIGIPTPGYPGGNYRDSEYGTDEADAALISAAPDLIAALSELVDCISETRGKNADAALHAARAALARANGVTHG